MTSPKTSPFTREIDRSKKLSVAARLSSWARKGRSNSSDESASPPRTAVPWKKKSSASRLVVSPAMRGITR